MNNEELKEKWRDFFQTYPNIDKPIYIPKIKILKANDETALWVDFQHILDYDLDLAEFLLDKPETCLKAGICALEELYNPDSKRDFWIRPYNTTRKFICSSIRTRHASTFVSLEGIIMSASEVKARPIEICWQCLHCGQLHFILQESIYGSPTQPAICSNPACGKNHFVQINEESKYHDFQFIILQENPQAKKGGAPPQHIACFAKEDLTGELLPGEKIDLEGIISFQKISRMNLYDLVLGIYSFTRKKKTEEIILTEEDKEELKQLVNDPSYYRKLIASIAPDIYGYEQVKEALLLSTIWGREIILPDGRVKRYIPHVLLVGDPGIGKSQMIEAVVKLFDGVMTSGKGVTGVGLTAACVQSHEFGWELRPGSLVLADGGVCGIDELDKMRSEDRDQLNGVLSSNLVYISKGGINAILNARCTVLAACNPVMGRWNPMQSVREQLDLPESLLNRFDLIYILMDKPEEGKDRKIGERILDVHQEKSEILNPPYSATTMRKIFTFARQFNPKITSGARQKIINYWLLIRKGSSEGEITITARQIEGIIRLAQERSKLFFRDTVTEEDGEAAVGLFNAAYRQSHTDPETGLLEEVSILGKGKPQRERYEKAHNLIVWLFDLYKDYYTEKNIKRIGIPISIVRAFLRAEDLSENPNIMIEEFSRQSAIYLPPCRTGDEQHICTNLEGGDLSYLRELKIRYGEDVEKFESILELR